MAEAISPSVLSDLAPAGKLRVGINYGNPVLATRDPASGDLRGVAVDLARELGKRVNLPVELVAFDSAGKMFDAAKDGAWDMAFLAIDPGGQTRLTSPLLTLRSKVHTSCRRDLGSRHRRRRPEGSADGDLFGQRLRSVFESQHSTC